MKGKGLITAAAVIQLVGAGCLLLAALGTLFIVPATKQSVPDANTAAVTGKLFVVVGLFYLLLAAVTTWVSIKLIQRRRWAWIVSLVMSCLSGGLLLLVMVAGLAGFMMGGKGLDQHAAVAFGVGEAAIFFMVGVPIYVTIGLLIGGRGAIGDAAVPRA